MSTEVTWTDEEIRGAVQNNFGCFSAVQEWAGILRGLGAVHPAEARKRERRAWLDGARGGMAQMSAKLHNVVFHWPTMEELECEMNSALPSLLPQTPPPLVLSTEKWTRTRDGLWNSGFGGGNIETGWVTPHIKTPADARAFAEWLEKYGDAK